MLRTARNKIGEIIVVIPLVLFYAPFMVQVFKCVAPARSASIILVVMHIQPTFGRRFPVLKVQVVLEEP